MTLKPGADWCKVAGDVGLKDAKCAKERFRQMSVRHGWRIGAQGTASNNPSKGKKKDVTSPSEMARRLRNRRLEPLKRP